LNILRNTEEDLENELSLPDVNISSLNVEQKFAFNLVMKTLIKFENNSTDFTPLMLIVTGSAGCGKSYLIKCLVKAVKMLYNSNKSVQVVCSTGNSANLISGVTIHSFFLNSNITQIKRF
jgi:predicted ATPase